MVLFIAKTFLKIIGWRKNSHMKKLMKDELQWVRRKKEEQIDAKIIVPSDRCQLAIDIAKKIFQMKLAIRIIK